MKRENKIDFVMLWVDDTDENWLKEKRKYMPSGIHDSGSKRYRSWDNLQYWFRGVEKYAPWVNKIFFVTCGQRPSWLNPDHPKIRLVDHKDFIPEEYLPTFSSNVILLHLHRIADLSEQFVLFNDDVFLSNPVKPEDFFVDGYPVDEYNEYPVGSGINPLMSHVFVNNNTVISRHFSRKEILRKQRSKILSPRYGKLFFYNLIMYLLPFPNYFGILNFHLAGSYLKSTMREVWSKESAILEDTSRHRFRQPDDVSDYVFRMWMLAEGRFVPGNKMNYGKMFKLGENNEAIYKELSHYTKRMFCLADDALSDDEFDEAKNRVNSILDSMLPNKSSYEV